MINTSKFGESIGRFLERVERVRRRENKKFLVCKTICSTQGIYKELKFVSI